jgi:hypothetical protein
VTFCLVPGHASGSKKAGALGSGEASY